MFSNSDLNNGAIYKREYFLQGDVCRFCWTKDPGKDLHSQMISCTQESPLFFKILNCLNIDLSLDDSEYHHKNVCQDCINKIDEFNDFKIFCQYRNQTLLQILNTSDDISSPIVEVDFSGELEPIKDEKVDDNCNFDLSDSDAFNCVVDRLENSEPVLEYIIEPPNSSSNTNQASQATRSPNVNTENYKDETSKYSKLTTSDERKSLKKENKQRNGHGKTKKLKAKPKSLRKPKELSKTKKTCRKAMYKKKKTATYCNICCQNFKDQEILIQHNSEEHGIEKDGSYKCFGCGKLHLNRKTRFNHEGSCKELENGYKCSVCYRYLPKRGVYEKHMKDHRSNKVVDAPDDNIFKCTKCFEQFSKKADWKAHMDVHITKKKYVCETCGRVFNRHDYLQRHRVTHTGERKYECAQCGFRTTQKNNLTIHIRKHTDERPYQCDLCPQRCVSSSNLRAHQRRHLGLNSFQCSICSKKFGYKISLKEHIAITHERSQKHPCPHCSAVYARARALRRHLLTKHAGEPSNTDKKNTAPDVEQNTSGAMYNLSSSTDEHLHAKQNESIPLSNLNGGSVATQEENQQFDLKIGENERFVCFEKNLNFDLKGEKIVIVLQE